ncbi:MAG: AAA family ATPase, partial [Planctomycetota bacterium]
VVWSMTSGLIANNKGTLERLVADGKPLQALQTIKDTPLCGIYVFKDLGAHLKDLTLLRLLRDIHNEFSLNRSTLILVDSAPLPDSIRRFTLPYEIKPPTFEELELVVRNTFRKIAAESIYEVKAEITKRQMEQLVQSLRGLSCAEAQRVVASVIYQNYKLDGSDLSRVIDAKRRVLASAGCLESVAVDRAAEDIGGLTNLKAWLKVRRGSYSDRAREFGLEPPRGMLLLGVQGCGKSLCAKAVAADWNMPLLKLDPGVLYQKFIGESESQLRLALRQAEAMAPVILWVDEIEKAFASASASSSDGGLSQRMFGTLLSWMQEHRHPIFLIATANNIEALPPELMRKGRFDEIFFVDLPSVANRQGILKIHLQRRQRQPDDFDLEQLATTAAGFSGAELEQVIMAALYRAFAEGIELETRHILEEIRATRPLSVVLGEKVTRLRAWAKERCVAAD